MPHTFPYYAPNMLSSPDYCSVLTGFSGVLLYISYTQTQKVTVVFSTSTCYNIATSAMSAHSLEEHNPAEDQRLLLSTRSFLAPRGRLLQCSQVAG